LSVVTLGCRDLPAQRAFYLNLGFAEVAASTDEWAAYRLAGCYLALYPVDLLGAEAAPGEPTPGTAWNGITLAINVETSDDVDAVFAAAVEAGAMPINEPSDRSYGPRASYVADPEGNRWEIVWSANTSIDDQGLLSGLGDAT
jgi:hypothetical protein